ncbi:chromosome partitioning protein, ParB family [Microbacterium sp. cf046]|uniref:ParB/RepB/Spo0J family partition protein n=1 Tax=Microbacterium sp. cf046 TaxID=1761803 RepID=UPI0008E6F21D|nr:ParB N-terminal domain-containing protein [Microbacterium sp. cf046]SFS16550.1 chromosome partitioning protein, ParB family [Microbacterium sp. cf046]
MKQQGHIELERAVDSIRVGSRHRVDLGDVEALAESIERQGLLQPITVTPEGVLVCGARRLAALRQLDVRKVSVWVRAGISDRLTQVLAEQDENSLHKPLSPTEAAALYRECKALLTEDAARRQIASRFGAVAETGEPDGAVTLTAPAGRNEGDTRTQAAVLVTGRRSFTTLERIGRLQDIASDESLPPEVRQHAQRELDAVENGAPVLPAFRRVSEDQVLSQLDTVARTSTESIETRRAAAEAASRMRAGDEPSWGEDPKQVVVRALTRPRSSNPNSRVSQGVPSAELKRFVFTWDDLADWWQEFDPSVIAAGLAQDEWDRFESTLEGSIRFADRVRQLRGDGSAASQRAS